MFDEVSVIDEVAISEEVLAHMLTGSTAEDGELVGLSQKPAHRPTEDIEITRVLQQHTGSLRDLIDDAAYGRGDHRTGLPHRLSDG